MKDYGEWAIVTGGSDGIGRGYALELAKRGLNVVGITNSWEDVEFSKFRPCLVVILALFQVCLISRTESKLSAVCSEIESKHKVKTEYIVFDFMENDYDELQQKLLSFSWIKETAILVKEGV